MPKVKISEFSSTPANNTDIDSINISEGCAPSGINDAIRELMAQLKDFQTGAVGDSFNGPVGTSTAAAGSFTTLAASGAVTLSGGTANGVAYLNGSKVVTSGSALTFDGTNLGVGTSSPAVKLDIEGTGTQSIFIERTDAITAGVFQFSAGNTSNTFGSSTAKPLVFLMNSSEVARFDTSGNLGLGVTPSAWRSVDRVMQAGSGVSQFGHFVSGGVGAVYGGGFYRDDSGFKYTLTATPAGRFDFNYTTSGGFTWNIAPSGTAGNAITFTQAMTLDASGNLGVGTTSPSAKFEVKAGNGGQMALNNDGSQYTTALWQNNGTSKVQAYWDQTNTLFAIGPTAASSALVFQTVGSERCRIDSSGNLLVGTTGLDGRFRVEVGAANWARATNHTNSGTQYFDSFRYNGTEIGKITGNNSNVSYVTSSDYRLKDNIQPMTGALATVALLKPCTYTWKIDGASGQGFIAHELQAVVPDAVVGEKDAVNEDGSIKPQGIDTSFLVATLTAALQEAHGLIKSLEARVVALEAK